MRKAMNTFFVATLVALWCGPGMTQAQEENKPSEENKPKAERPERPVHAYRVDFSVDELEDGKKINTRRYSMNLNSGDRHMLKIGTRVPIATGSFQSDNPLVNTQFQYLDVGTSINCRLEEKGDDLALDVDSQFSNFSTPDEQHTSRSVVRTQPIIRQININGSTLATSGKPVVIGSVDDPNSNREFQLELTATRLK